MLRMISLSSADTMPSGLDPIDRGLRIEVYDTLSDI